MGTTVTAQNITATVAGFPPHTNLAKLQSMRTKFMDLTTTAYHKRTNFGLATYRVQKYQCFG